MEQISQSVNFLNYIKWYDNIEVVYEMMRCMRDKEVAVINPFKKAECIRNIKINNAQQVYDVGKWINADKRTWNWYVSLAAYKEGIPNQTFNMEERDNTKWNEEHWKHIRHFDFLIDFDCDTHDLVKEAKLDVLRVSNLLSTIPHSIRYSGMGYHILIPGEYMPQGLSYDPDAEDNYYDMLHDLLEAIRRKHSDFVDTGCHDPRRVVKIPYSLALYEDDNYVCWPLRTVRELDKDPISYLSSSVLREFEPVRNRGVPLLNMEKKVDYTPFKLLLGKKWDKYVRIMLRLKEVIP
jgi:hypothetical protein